MMRSGFRGAPYDRMMARQRRARITSWCLFLLLVVCVFGSRILRH